MAHEKKGPVTKLKEQFDEKSNSCKSLEQEYLRALADFDNLRRRTARENEVSRRIALEALILDLLPVLDNFDRAAQAANVGATTDSVKKGLDLIQRQLREALCKHGLTEYSCVGTQFDPRKAEAISFVHTDEQKPGTVVSEICKGYACGERILRPARVVVAKEPARSQKPEARSENAEEADSGDERSQKVEDSGQKSEEAEDEAGESGGASKD